MSHVLQPDYSCSSTRWFVLLNQAICESSMCSKNVCPNATSPVWHFLRRFVPTQWYSKTKFSGYIHDFQDLLRLSSSLQRRGETRKEELRTASNFLNLQQGHSRAAGAAEDHTRYKKVVAVRFACSFHFRLSHFRRCWRFGLKMSLRRFPFQFVATRFSSPC